MKRSTGKKKQRLTLALSEETNSRLESLTVKTDSDSLSETIKRALVIYESLVDVDGEVIIRCGKTEKTLVYK